MSKKEKAKTLKLELEKAIIRFLESEGCTCCQDIEEHEAALVEIGQFFNWPVYDDGSGVDWYARRDQLKRESNRIRKAIGGLEVCEICNQEMGDPHHCRPDWSGEALSEVSDD